MSDKKKFKRAGHGRENSTDLVGDVVIKCLLYGPKGLIKGNRVTTIRIRGAKVTEVHAAIEKALFE